MAGGMFGAGWTVCTFDSGLKGGDAVRLTRRADGIGT
jgi:hypothetical protein